MKAQARKLLDSMLETHGEEAVLEVLVATDQRLRIQKALGDGERENPFDRRAGTFNLTKQAELLEKDPVLAEILQEEAKLRM